MADLFWVDGFQFFDDSGNPLNAGTINTYDAGTLSARTVYQDDGETVPWSQPITLNSAGRLTASVYVPTGDWKFILKTSAGVTVTTEDNIPGAVAAASADFASPETPIITKAASYTVTEADVGSMFVVDSTGGNVTLSLPAAGLVASGRGIVVLHNGSANSVIIDGSGAETINGAATLTLSGKPACAVLTSDGASAWYARNPLGGGQLTGALDWKAAVSVASAASVDLGAQTSNLVEITGSTGPITSFGTAPSGEARWVKFASTPTITHNGTSLILPGALSITAVAGDTALFVSEGSGNWRCYWYSGKATDAHVYAAAAGRYFTTDLIESASEFVTLTDAANISLDWDAGINRSLTVGGNRTLDNPTNGQPGTRRTIVITQDGTGSRTLAYGNQYHFAGGVEPTLSTAAGSIDVLELLCRTSTLFYGSISKDYKA